MLLRVHWEQALTSELTLLLSVSNKLPLMSNDNLWGELASIADRNDDYKNNNKINIFESLCNALL
jgi:hypothetical protein